MNILFNKVEKLQKASQDAFSIFTKTVTKLKDLNKSIKVELDSRKQKMDDLQAEVNTLNLQTETNNKVIERINQIVA